MPDVKTPTDAMGAYLGLTGSTVTTPPTAPIAEILDGDPYVNDPLRMNMDDRVNASALFSLILKDTDQTRRTAEVVGQELRRFIFNFERLPEAPEIDKADVSNELTGSGLRSFRESLMLLVSRFLVAAAKLGREIDSKKLEEILRNGFFAYAKVYSADIPYYDKVYQDFDQEWEKGRSPQEVYLGRDGMYAYIGRRAQDLSVRRVMGLNERIDAEKDGKEVAINPKYLIYPRFYRDKLARETKKEYLKSQGVALENDPIFFDTGFTGTVPEQILSILGASTDEMDDRIKMLSALSEKRRVKGISTSERSNIVDAIEYNMKPEEPSSGIMRTKDGRLKPVAKPTTPEEQFIFGMIRLALVRHYWLKART